MPDRCGPWSAAHRRLARWRDDGTLGRVLDALRLELDEKGLVDRGLWLADASRRSLLCGTGVRAGRSAAGANNGRPARPPDQALGRSRGGFGTKVHLLAGGNGLPLAATLTAGQAHEGAQVEALLAIGRVGRRTRPGKLAGDKGHSCPRVRRLLWARGVNPAIPRRSDQPGKRGRPAGFEREAHRRRNAVGRCVGWLKGERRVGARQDKLATRFFGFVQLAMMKVLLRRLRNTT